MVTWRMSWLVILLAIWCTPALSTEPSTFIVHEWGTFTALQNDEGRELPGINIDDEPVPSFVHNLAPLVLNRPFLTKDHWIYRQKGAPRQHPRVTMRLETPVLYFYPAADGSLPKTVDVDVLFRGGWLTEFYPYAKAKLPGLEDNSFNFGALSPQTKGGLAWKDVRLNTQQAGPETDEQVWTAPRKVNAVDVSVAGKPVPEGEPVTESERYLFYRGVANQPAPLQVATDRKLETLTIRANFAQALCKTEALVPAVWLAEIRADGQVAFRTLDPLTVNSDPQRVVGTCSYKFSPGDYATKNMQALREAMHAALVKDGLYDDEATAMLTTWQRAYFQSPGLRLFFVVPRCWTDHYLPLRITGEPDITRVMMGRIELITQSQRAVLQKLAAGPVSESDWVEKIPESPEKQAFLAGRTYFGDLGVEIPADYTAYLSLGRFRNALVIAEQRRKATPALDQFINRYGVQPYKWAEE